MEATGNGTARHLGGAPFTDTRIPVDTHRMSNCSFVRPAFSRIVRKKIACASFHAWSLVWSSLECAPHVFPFDFDRCPNQGLLKVQLNTFTVLRSDPVHEPQDSKSQSNLFLSVARFRILSLPTKSLASSIAVPAPRIFPPHLRNLSFRYGKPQKVLCITWAAKLRALRILPLHSLRHHCFCFPYRRLPHSVSRSASRPHGVPQSVMFTVRSDLFLSPCDPSRHPPSLFARSSEYGTRPLQSLLPWSLVPAAPSCLPTCQTPPSGAVSASQSVSPHALPIPAFAYAGLRSSKSRHCSRPFPLTRSCCRAITVWRQHDIPTAFLAAPSINSLVTSSSFFSFARVLHNRPRGASPR